MPHVCITDSDFSATDKSFEYILWFQPSLWAIILSDTKVLLLFDGRYFSKLSTIDEDILRERMWKGDIKIEKIECEDIFDGIVDQLKDEISITLENNIALKHYNFFKTQLSNTEIHFSEGYFINKRIHKTPQEIWHIQKAIEIIDETFLYIKTLAETGQLHKKTEQEVRQLIISQIFLLWGQWESFPSIVAFGKNSSIPHHSTGETRIGNGPLLIDMWAIYKWYCSDFTRTIWVWEKTQEYDNFVKIYEIVKKSHLASISEFHTWMRGKDLYEISRDYIEKSWYGAYYTHGLGHGVGLDIHEEPKLKKTWTILLKDSMVFTIEPWIYLPWKFWVRLEDIVFLRKNRLEKYTKIPI